MTTFIAKLPWCDNYPWRDAEQLVEGISRHLLYDAEDGDLFWCETGRPYGGYDTAGYIRGQFFGRQTYAHHLVWFMHKLEWPVQMIDHINRDKADNHIENLRYADHSLQSHNKDVNARNSSGITGVSFDERVPKTPWLVRITNKGVMLVYGYYATKAEAVAVAEQTYSKLKDQINGSVGADS